MRSFRIAVIGVVAYSRVLSCAWMLGLFLHAHVAAQSSAESVVYLDQGWSQADREMWYQISQGSTIIAYDIFLNLEVAGSQELFRSDANSERYGLITQAANPQDQPGRLASRFDKDGGDRRSVEGRVQSV